MKLISIDCREALKNYKSENADEAMAINVLLQASKQQELTLLYKLTGVHLFRVVESVGKIAKELGIETKSKDKEEEV